MNKAQPQSLAQFFHGKSIGKSLKEVAIDLVKTQGDNLESRWFHSAMSTDLYTWVDRSRNIIKQQLSFHGQVVEWNCLEGIKTGVIIESDLQNAPSTEKEGDKVSETILFDLKPQLKAVGLALEILDHFEVDKGFHEQLVGNFRDPQNIETMAPKIFLERFGMSVHNSQGLDSGFWDACKKRLHSLFKR